MLGGSEADQADLHDRTSSGQRPRHDPADDGVGVLCSGEHRSFGDPGASSIRQDYVHQHARWQDVGAVVQQVQAVMSHS